MGVQAAQAQEMLKNPETMSAMQVILSSCRKRSPRVILSGLKCCKL